ncbi:MAG: hypothetical protein ACLUTU_14695 [Blautia faecis]
MVLVGGGSCSMIWKQILADIMGLPVLTPINPVEAPFGRCIHGSESWERVNRFYSDQ